MHLCRTQSIETNPSVNRRTPVEYSPSIKYVVQRFFRIVLHAELQRLLNSLTFCENTAINATRTPMRLLNPLSLKNEVVTQNSQDASFQRVVTWHGHSQLPYGITNAARRTQHLHQSNHVTRIPNILETNLRLPPAQLIATTPIPKALQLDQSTRIYTDTLRNPNATFKILRGPS